jgi:hypothetical protein
MDPGRAGITFYVQRGKAIPFEFPERNNKPRANHRPSHDNNAISAE